MAVRGRPRHNKDDENEGTLERGICPICEHKLRLHYEAEWLLRGSTLTQIAKEVFGGYTADRQKEVSNHMRNHFNQKQQKLVAVAENERLRMSLDPDKIAVTENVVKLFERDRIDDTLDHIETQLNQVNEALEAQLNARVKLADIDNKTIVGKDGSVLSEKAKLLRVPIQKELRELQQQLLDQKTKYIRERLNLTPDISTTASAAGSLIDLLKTTSL